MVLFRKGIAESGYVNLRSIEYIFNLLLVLDLVMIDEGSLVHLIAGLKGLLIDVDCNLLVDIEFEFVDILIKLVHFIGDVLVDSDLIGVYLLLVLKLQDYPLQVAVPSLSLDVVLVFNQVEHVVEYLVKLFYRGRLYV